MDNMLNNREVLAQLPAPSTNGVGKTSSTKPFIEANTQEISLRELQEDHIIPVFSATNEPLISHQEIIETVIEAAQDWFPHETFLKPSIRVSHPVKGRIPEAKHKKSHELEPWEQTLFNERMAFVVEIPGIRSEVNGNDVAFAIGGVKAYNLDNLYGKRPRGDQHIQLFVGFKNQVCCNLCISTDGVKTETGVRTLDQLRFMTQNMLTKYKMGEHLKSLQKLDEYSLTEHEFAQFVGRARMVKHIPEVEKETVPLLQFGDQQIGSVVKSYYHDENFAADYGSINMWRLYNLLTGANKSTYIDQFIGRGVNAGDIIRELIQHKAGLKSSWYLS